MHWFGMTWLKAFGWKLVGERELPKRFVFVAAPHTSNWDFPFMMATAWSLGIRIRWLGKHTLFEGPFGWIFRGLGGIPVDRRAAHGLVAEVANLFEDTEELRLAVPPEGTRKKVAFWKSGFYHIAVAAGVPIGLSFLDFARRECGLGMIFHPTGNIAADMDVIREFYSDIRGKHPERESVPRLREEAGEIRLAG